MKAHPLLLSLLGTLALGLWTLSSTSFAASANKTVKTDTIAQGVNAAVTLLPATGAKSSPDKAIHIAFDEARRLYKDLDQKSGGEVVKINKSAGKDKIKVSGAMLTLLKVCMQISEWTQGLFDVVHSSSNKKDASLQVDFGRGEVQLLAKKSWIDFTGIRNGYIVDRMAGRLKSEGYNDFKVEVGGTPNGAASAVVRTMGRDGGGYWWHNVADPDGSGKELCRVSLEASSVATANRNNSPSSAADLRSVTIITRNATNATALARTALQAGKERSRSILGALTEPGFGAILEDQYGKIQTIGDVTAACFQE